MNAESIRVMRTEVWTDWEDHVVNGTFPLHRFLGSSNHSAVFLTEYAAHSLPQVAIKFVPADNLHTEAQQLVQWGAVATLSHPHLVRIYDVGRCQFGGRGFLFAVMEYAEQTLAEILPKRPLTAEEVREMLPPVLEGLSFLHRNNLAHGQLKPANILVVNDQLKLSSDTARSPGHPTVGGLGRTYLYDPPELTTTGTSTAGDVWALGVTLVEALTQRYPVPDERSQTPLLPAGVPAEFTDVVRRCLSRTPANRPTVLELDAQYKPTPAPPVLPPAEEVVETLPPEPAPREESPKGRLWVTTLAVALLLAAAGWFMWRFFLGDSNSAPTGARGSEAPRVAAAASTDARAPVERPTTGVGSPAAQIGGPPAAQGGDSPATQGGSQAARSGSENAAASAGSPVEATPAVDSVPAAGVAQQAGLAPAGGGGGLAPTADLSQPAGLAHSDGLPQHGGFPQHGGLAQPSSLAHASNPAPAAGSATPLGSTVPASPAVLYQVIPDVSQPILNKIRGHIVVKVRVLVDPTGTVVGQFMENAGPSRYFARLAAEAAAEWKFSPGEGRDARVWLLRFEFERSGSTVQSSSAP